MADIALDGLVERVKGNRDTAEDILEKLKKAMAARGHARPTTEIEKRVSTAEVNAILEELEEQE